MSQGPPGGFPATRHSVVRDLGSADPQARAAAYEALARTYWRPVYTYIRLRWRRDPDEAQDLAQEFFTRAFEREYLARYDPAKARFRTFVRTCLDGFLANETRRPRGSSAAAPLRSRRSISLASTPTWPRTRAATIRIPSAGFTASGSAACSPTPSSGCGSRRRPPGIRPRSRSFIATTSTPTSPDRPMPRWRARRDCA